MEGTGVQRLARILRGLVLTVLAANMVGLLLVPGIAAYVTDGGPGILLQALQGEVARWMGEEGNLPILKVFVVSWWMVWTQWHPALVTLFYWLCGGCTAVILWQAKRILDTILAGNPFRSENSISMKRAAACCWTVSAAALVRMVIWLNIEGNLAPLFTYNTLFVPVFLWLDCSFM
ncbi:MAG: DUF2975 domain-containing protein [Lawsonibacter sp.]